MNWLSITIVAYFLLALEIILDKFLLSSKRVSHPAIYAFYSGTLGLFAIIIGLVSGGLHFIDFHKIVFSFIAGTIFIYGMLSLFFAVRKGEASRVLPVVGAVIPITTFFLSIIFLHERLGMQGIFGIAALIFGGLLISFELDKIEKRIFFKGFRSSLLAGFFLALSAIMIKALYNGDNFLNVFAWTRGGAFLGTLSFFLIPVWRKAILGSLLKFKKSEKEEKKSGLSFVLAKIFGGSGSFLKEFATSLTSASVTIVSALVSVEYVFIFILSIIFSAWVPEIMREKKDLKTILQKIFAIILIAIGIVFVSNSKIK
jgi:drug/metabolite transporter (DMT)-like permease